MFDTDRCAQCKSMAGDINDVMIRKSRLSNYRSRAHAGNVLESVCVDLPMRFPWPAARKLQAFCDEMLEEYEDELITSIVGSTTEPQLVDEVCGKITNSCKKTQLADNVIWRSPFNAINQPPEESKAKESKAEESSEAHGADTDGADADGDDTDGDDVVLDTDTGSGSDEL
jgi:hypothetical protein